MGSGVAHATSPISISTCTQLQAIGATSTEPVTGSYVLTQNVDCSATVNWNPNGSGGYYGFSPIPDFTGTFNGGGYSISGLYINIATTTLESVGLFQSIDATSTVENLTLSGGSISGGQYIGSIAGEMYASSTIQNVTSSASVTNTQGYLGGLVGYATGVNTTIASSSASGAVSSTYNSSYYEGGLVGKMNGTISNASSSASVTDTGQYGEYIGGLAGYTNGPVLNSYATGPVLASGYESYYVGGLIGESQAAITNAYETGSVTANGSYDEYIGGLIGTSGPAAIASSSATGAVSASGASGEYLGGFIAESYGPISNSYETGSVTGTTTTEYMGGFVGEQENSSATISQCYETGNVISGYYSGGGFVGGAYANITKSFSTGNISFPGVSYLEYDGGFVGFSEVPIDNDYSTGNVTIPANLTGNNVADVGGFDGWSVASITNSYESGTITGTGGYTVFGGFVGYNNAPIINSYSTVGGSGFSNMTSGSAGYFVGENEVTTLTNDAEYVQGTPAIGDDVPYSSTADALLATHGYGTDESTLANFYSTTEPVYAQATTTAWNFSSIWTPHANALPTFQWYSGVTPNYTITATAGTGGTINNSGAVSVLSGANQTYTITPSSGYTISNVLVDGTSVGAVSTYTFTNVTTNHSIAVTFAAIPSTPAPSNNGGGGTSYGGGTVENRVNNLLQNGNAPAATTLMQQYPNLFPTTAANTVTASTAVTAPKTSTAMTNTAFTRSLTLGSTGTDVKALQQYLNRHGFMIATTGPGSLSNETTYFGKATRTALAKFQKASGISPASGYFGSITRAYIQAHP